MSLEEIKHLPRQADIVTSAYAFSQLAPERRRRFSRFLHHKNIILHRFLIADQGHGKGRGVKYMGFLKPGQRVDDPAVGERGREDIWTNEWICWFSMGDSQKTRLRQIDDRSRLPLIEREIAHDGVEQHVGTGDWDLQDLLVKWHHYLIEVKEGTDVLIPCEATAFDVQNIAFLVNSSGTREITGANCQIDFQSNFGQVFWRALKRIKPGDWLEGWYGKDANAGYADIAQPLSTSPPRALSLLQHEAFYKIRYRGVNVFLVRNQAFELNKVRADYVFTAYTKDVSADVDLDDLTQEGHDWRLMTQTRLAARMSHPLHMAADSQFQIARTAARYRFGNFMVPGRVGPAGVFGNVLLTPIVNQEISHCKGVANLLLPDVSCEYPDEGITRPARHPPFLRVYRQTVFEALCDVNFLTGDGAPIKSVAMPALGTSPDPGFQWPRAYAGELMANAVFAYVHAFGERGNNIENIYIIDDKDAPDNVFLKKFRDWYQCHFLDFITHEDELNPLGLCFKQHPTI